MFKKLALICVVGILLPFGSKAQLQTVRALKIGDTIPDITLTNVHNYPDSAIRLRDLKGKLTILDFWSTWCGACIAAFPETQRLQNEFGDRIQFLLINIFESDDYQRVKAAFSKREKETGFRLDLPYSLSQTTLEGVFPFRFIPHYAWIDEDGVLVATTSHIEITAENIQSVLNKKAITFRMKKDLIEFDRRKPLFEDANAIGAELLVFRSTFTSYIEGAGHAIVSSIMPDGKTRYCVYNSFLFPLLKTAFGLDQINNNRFIFNSERSDLFLTPPDASDRYLKSYCYELITFRGSLEEIKGQMRNDLKNSFQVTITKIPKKVSTYLIEPLPGKKTKKRPDGTMELRLSDFVERYDLLSETPIRCDDTYSDHLIRITPNFYELDLRAIEKMLPGLGLSKKETIRNMDMYLVADL